MSIDLATRDFEASALSRLPGYLNKQRRREYLEVIASELQEVDDAIVEIAFQLHLDNATDAMLDLIGSRVGQPRAGMEDAAYRTAIRGRVAVQRSLGLSEDLIKVARLVLNDADLTVTLRPEPPAALAIVVGGEVGTPDALAEALIGSARAAVDGGVRVVVESSTLPDSATFSFFNGPGVGFAGTPPSPLDLSAITGRPYDSAVGLRVYGTLANGYTLSFVADAAAPNGGDFVISGTSITFRFKDGVTTIGDFEHQIDGNDHDYLTLESTSGAAGTLIAPDDEFADEPFTSATGNGVGAFATAKE